MYKCGRLDYLKFGVFHYLSSKRFQKYVVSDTYIIPEEICALSLNGMDSLQIEEMMRIIPACAMILVEKEAEKCAKKQILANLLRCSSRHISYS